MHCLPVLPLNAHNVRRADPPAAPVEWLKPGPARLGLVSRALYSAQTRIRRWGRSHLDLINRVHGRLTVRDLFPGVGDTLLTGIVCRHVHERWPHIRINCVSRHPDLLLHDPHIAELNGPPGLFVLDSWYLDLVQRRDNSTNVLAQTLQGIGIRDFEYRAKVYLTAAEIAWATAQLKSADRPRIAINLLSAVRTKNWPLQHWKAAIEALRERGSLIHIGGPDEPQLTGVHRFAGASNRRESLALLSQCDVFVGPVSFLMHAANGLDVPSVVTYGGQHSPAVSGYAANRNLHVDLPCGGCWLTGDPGDECPHDLACQHAIEPETVIRSVEELLRQAGTPARARSYA